MHLLEPIFSASFLNDKGDIIAALHKNLVVIQADNYQFLTADEMASLVTEHAKSQQQQQQPGQPVTPAAINAQRAAVQLMKTGSKAHQALVRQTTLAQVGCQDDFLSMYMHVYLDSLCLLCFSIQTSPKTPAISQVIYTAGDKLPADACS